MIKDTKDLTSHKLQHLLLKHTHTEIAKMYGVSRQRIHQIQDRMIDRGLMSDKFIKDSTVATLKSLDKATNVEYDIDIISIHFDLDRILIVVDDSPPRWVGLRLSKKGIHFQWSFNHQGRLIRRFAYLDDFTVIDDSQWEYITNNAIANNTIRR